MNYLYNSVELPALPEPYQYSVIYGNDSKEYKAASFPEYGYCELGGERTLLVDASTTSYFQLNDGEWQAIDSSKAYLAHNGYVGVGTYGGRYFDVLSMMNSAKFPFFYFLKKCGVNNKCMAIGMWSSAFYGMYFDERGILKVGIFKNPNGAVHATYFTLYNLSDLEFNTPDSPAVWTCSTNGNGYGSILFYSKELALNYPNYLTTACGYIDWDACGDFLNGYGQYEVSVHAFTKPSSGTIFATKSGSASYSIGHSGTSSNFSRLDTCSVMDGFSLLNTFDDLVWTNFKVTNEDGSSYMDATKPIAVSHPNTGATTSFLNKTGLATLVAQIKSWINAKLDMKVDKVEGKGLSTNDFTDEHLAKLNDAAPGATEEQIAQIQENTEAIADIQLRTVSGSVTRQGQVVTMSFMLDDGTQELHVMQLDNDDYPTSLSVNGTEIPIDWSGFKNG
jgi:hypothetical protein